MGDVIQLGDVKVRVREKVSRLLDRAGLNDMLIAEIIGVAPRVSTSEDDADPRNPNVIHSSLTREKT